MKISELKHPEKNPRKHPQRQINEMARSLKMFGQYRPIVVDENNIILAGNGLIMAMHELGYEEADVLKYNNLTDSQKKKLMIADNQVADLGVNDYGIIEEIIRSIDKEDLDIPGYDDETLALIVEESQTAINEVNNYGIYSQEEVDRLKEIERERAENGFKAVEQTFNSNPTYPSVENFNSSQYASNEPVTQNNQEEPRQYAKVNSGETERYIICPHCGEKIYI